MEGPSYIDLSCFSAAKSLVNHTTNYGRLIDLKAITRKPVKRARSDNYTDGDWRTYK